MSSLVIPEKSRFLMSSSIQITILVVPQHHYIHIIITNYNYITVIYNVWLWTEVPKSQPLEFNVIMASPPNVSFRGGTAQWFPSCRCLLHIWSGPGIPPGHLSERRPAPAIFLGVRNRGEIHLPSLWSNSECFSASFCSLMRTNKQKQKQKQMCFVSYWTSARVLHAFMGKGRIEPLKRTWIREFSELQGGFIQ